MEQTFKSTNKIAKSIFFFLRYWKLMNELQSWKRVEKKAFSIQWTLNKRKIRLMSIFNVLSSNFRSFSFPLTTEIAKLSLYCTRCSNKRSFNVNVYQNVYTALLSLSSFFLPFFLLSVAWWQSFKFNPHKKVFLLAL